jgi:NADPH-dependent 2,4-dienoyl-CoA reductase/sulfur reductase-like enzyme
MPRQLALRNPTDSEAASCFGLNEVIDRDDVCDLIVVGAGPSGLAAAVYGGASGLGGNIAEAILASGVNQPGGWKSAADFNRQANYDGKVLRERRRSNAGGWIYFFVISRSPVRSRRVAPETC